MLFRVAANTFSMTPTSKTLTLERNSRKGRVKVSGRDARRTYGCSRAPPQVLRNSFWETDVYGVCSRCLFLFCWVSRGCLLSSICDGSILLSYRRGCMRPRNEQQDDTQIAKLPTGVCCCRRRSHKLPACIECTTL